MHQKDLVKRAWADAGLYRRRDAKLQRFLKHLDDSPMECWPDLIELSRGRYSKYKEELMLPLWKSDSKLLRLNLIRAADPARSDEQDMLLKAIRGCRADRDPLELKAATLVGGKAVIEHVLKKRDISPDLKLLAEQRLAKMQPRKRSRRGSG